MCVGFVWDPSASKPIRGSRFKIIWTWVANWIGRNKCSFFRWVKDIVFMLLKRSYLLEIRTEVSVGETAGYLVSALTHSRQRWGAWGGEVSAEETDWPRWELLGGRCARVYYTRLSALCMFEDFRQKVFLTFWIRNTRTRSDSSPSFSAPCLFGH